MTSTSSNSPDIGPLQPLHDLLTPVFFALEPGDGCFLTAEAIPAALSGIGGKAELVVRCGQNLILIHADSDVLARAPTELDAARIALQGLLWRLQRHEKALITLLSQEGRSPDGPLAGVERVYRLVMTPEVREQGQVQGLLESAHAYLSDQESSLRMAVLIMGSLSSWLSVLGQLGTAHDVLDFLEYGHDQAAAVSQRTGRGALIELVALYRQYLDNGQPFARARRLEQYWLDEGLKLQPSHWLSDSLNSSLETFRRLQPAATQWHNLILHYCDQVKRLPIAEQAAHHPLLTALLTESRVAQAHLGDALGNSAALDAAESGEAYVMHLRSYHHSGRHYLLVFYGQGSRSKLGRAQLLPQLPMLAAQINERQQQPLLDDIVVIGLSSQGRMLEAADFAYQVGMPILQSVESEVQPEPPALPIEQSASTQAPATPARNAPCPCGSGQRYKNCCGKMA